MTPGRSLLSVVTAALLLLAQLHVWEAKGCSMCGASCRCTSHLSGDSCSLRSVGCGGDSGTTTGSASPLRAVLPDLSVVLARSERGRPSSIAARVPQTPARPPLDHPPRASC